MDIGTPFVELGRHLRNERKKECLIRELCDGAKVASNTLSRVECGYDMNLTTLCRIAEKLGFVVVLKKIVLVGSSEFCIRERK